MIELQKRQKDFFIKKYLTIKLRAITERYIMIANLVLDDVPGDKIAKQLSLIGQLKLYIKKIYMYSDKIEKENIDIYEMINISKSMIGTQEDINKEYKTLNIFNEANQSMIDQIINNYKEEVEMFNDYANSIDIIIPKNIKHIAEALIENDPDFKKDIEDIL